MRISNYLYIRLCMGNKTKKKWPQMPKITTVAHINWGRRRSRLYNYKAWKASCIKKIQRIFAIASLQGYLLEADQSDISRYKMATNMRWCCLRYSIWSNQEWNITDTGKIMLLSSKFDWNGGWASPWPEVKLQWHAAACIGSTTEPAHCYVRDWETSSSHAIPMSK